MKIIRNVLALVLLLPLWAVAAASPAQLAAKLNQAQRRVQSYTCDSVQVAMHEKANEAAWGASGFDKMDVLGKSPGGSLLVEGLRVVQFMLLTVVPWFTKPLLPTQRP